MLKRSPALVAACLAGSLLAVTLGLGPSQPEAPSLEPVLRRMDAVDARLTEIAVGVEAGRREAREQLTALRNEVAGLRADVSEIKLLLKGMARPAVPSGPAPLDLPSDPMASQDAMTAVMQARYAKQFGEPAANSEAGRRERQRDLERWVRDTNRDLRGKTRWVVRLEKVVEVPAAPDAGPRGEGASFLATYTVLDALTRRAIGTPQTHKVPGFLGKKLAEVPAGTLAEVGVFIAAEMVYSPDRAEAGIFGLPVMVGPYVEHGIRTDWASVELIKDSAKPEKPAGDPGR